MLLSTRSAPHARDGLHATRAMLDTDVIMNARLSATKIKAKFPYSKQIKLNELLLTNNTRIAAYPFLLTEKRNRF